MMVVIKMMNRISIAAMVTGSCDNDYNEVGDVNFSVMSTRTLQFIVWHYPVSLSTHLLVLI